MNVGQYYNRNTRRFLRFSRDKQSRNIHQPLYLREGMPLSEAIESSNQLVLEQAQAIKTPDLKILDAGCGVGSSVFYLAKQLPSTTQLHGVSISETQIQLARQFAQAQDREPQCHFHHCSYLELTAAIPKVHLAYAIEAFVHSPNPEDFFQSMYQQIVPGGKLVLIDDFINDEAEISAPQTEQWIADYKHGWMAQSLRPVGTQIKIAEKQGFTLLQNDNLTQYMNIGRPRDQVIGLMKLFFRKAMLRSIYWRSMAGGHAKQQCLKRGIMDYRILVFERPSAA